MKILVVCQYYYPEPFRITDICEELVQRGHKITVLTGLPNYPEGKILKEYKKGKHRDEIRNNVRIIRCYEHGRGKNAINMLWNYFSFAISGKRKVKKLDKDFDLVFINQLSPVMMAWPGIKYAKKYGKKTILYCYDLWPASLKAGGIRQKSLIYKFFGKISKKIYNSVDSLCVTSKSFVDYFIAEHNIDSNKIVYLPQYCEDLYENIVSKSHEGFNFIFAGNIGKMQSVETIIRAAELIKNRTDIKIHIVGDGRDLVNCKVLANELETNNVVFYGRKPIEEMEKFYSMADAMIVTLVKDEIVSKTLPGKVQSYMAAGKPILAAIDGEARLIIEESKCGICCQAEDYISFSKVMLLFVETRDPQFSINAYDYYIKNFKKECFFERLERVLFNAVK